MHLRLPVVDGGRVGLRAVEEVGADALGGQVAPRVEHAAPHVSAWRRRRRRPRRRRHRLRTLVAPAGGGGVSILRSN